MNKQLLTAFCLCLFGATQAVTHIDVINKSATDKYVRVKGRLIKGTGDKRHDRRSVGYTIKPGSTPQRFDFSGDVALIKVRIKPNAEKSTPKILSVKFSGKKVERNPRTDLTSAAAWVIEDNATGTGITIRAA